MAWHITERRRAGDLPILLADGPLRFHHPPFGGYPDRLLGLR